MDLNDLLNKRFFLMSGSIYDFYELIDFPEGIRGTLLSADGTMHSIFLAKAIDGRYILYTDGFGYQIFTGEELQKIDTTVDNIPIDNK